MWRGNEGLDNQVRQTSAVRSHSNSMLPYGQRSDKTSGSKTLKPTSSVAPGRSSIEAICGDGRDRSIAAGPWKAVAPPASVRAIDAYGGDGQEGGVGIGRGLIWWEEGVGREGSVLRPPLDLGSFKGGAPFNFTSF